MRSALRAFAGAIALAAAALVLQLPAFSAAVADSTWDSVQPGPVQPQVLDSTWD